MVALQPAVVFASPLFWKAHIQLTRAEARASIPKDQLNVRPIWHQREDRVQAYILVCFLAFVAVEEPRMWQSRSGLGSSPRSILEMLLRIESHDVVLLTPAHGYLRLYSSPSPTAPRPPFSTA